jgi:hypothetical protein
MKLLTHMNFIKTVYFYYYYLFFFLQVRLGLLIENSSALQIDSSVATLVPPRMTHRNESNELIKTVRLYLILILKVFALYENNVWQSYGIKIKQHLKC